MHQLDEDDRFLTESLEDNVQHGCEEDVEQQRGQHAFLPLSLLHFKLIQTDAIIRSHTSSHPIVELSDDCYYLRWYSDASEHLPQEGAGNGAVSFLKIYETHMEGRGDAQKV